jgi:hypothetical protein
MDRAAVATDGTDLVSPGLVIRRCVLRREDEVEEPGGEDGVERGLDVPAGWEDRFWGAPGARGLQDGMHVVAGQSGEPGGDDRPGSIHSGRPFEQRVQLPGPAYGGPAVARPQG